MPRRLAIELTGAEAHLLLLSASETRIKVEKSLCIPLLSDNKDNKEGTSPASPEQIVVDALSQNGISRVETIAVVGRADVELRLLNVPKVPKTELPEIVRFQAMQELPAIGEKTPLDYLPLEDVEAASQHQRVLAAVLKPGVMKRLEKICHDAKLTLIQIVLRPAATASLMLREKPELIQGCCLLVEVLGRHVDLAAVHHGQVVFLRHMLLTGNPMESSEASEILFDEIRRTRVVVANQENVGDVEPVVLVGNRPEHTRFTEQLASETGVSARLIDPLPQSMVADPDSAVSPAQSDYCAALLGAVSDETARRPQVFDFLHPRKTPEPPSRRNTYVLAALATATILLAVIVLNWLQTSQLEADIRRLQQEAVTLEPEAKKADKLVSDAGEVDDWLKGEVVWLEELAWLSEKFPEAKDAMLTNLSVTSNGQRREMRLSGYARDVDTAGKLDDGLRDSTHQVVGKTKNENSKESGYNIQFRSDVQISSPK
ncbi:MAG: hypothetical protein JXM70_06165 [Pirellulales bacterium]|nr:hypothetical protein [Pirellulales bacterium]